jgi:hypothetical protein
MQSRHRRCIISTLSFPVISWTVFDGLRIQLLFNIELQDMEHLFQQRLKQLHLENVTTILVIVRALTSGIAACAPLNGAINVAQEIISMIQVRSTLLCIISGDTTTLGWLLGYTKKSGGLH